MDRYIELVTFSYTKIKGFPFPEIPIENTRRNLLHNEIEKHQTAFGINYRIVSESGVYNKVTFKDIGRTDIRCYLSELGDNYITFECKRFVKNNIKKSYFYSEYIEEGIDRFRQNKYCESTNVGGMIAFIESGDFEKANRLFMQCLQDVSLDNIAEDQSIKYNHNYIFFTKNKRLDNVLIELTHVIMDFT